MMTPDTQETQIDIWEKWNWLWYGIFYTAIVVSFGLTLHDHNLSLPTTVVAGLTVVLGLWHGLGMALAYRHLISWEKYPTGRFVVLMGDIVLWFILVNISPAYYVTLFGLFIQVFRHLPLRYAVVTSLILTALMIVEQVTDAGETLSLANPTSWLLAFAGLASILVGVWISAIIDQSTKRRELIAQLEQAQSELAAAERRQGVLEERQRLAREIHDTLAQGFTSIVMHLEAAEQALPDDVNTLQKHLNQARSTARSSLEQARRVVQDLRPDLLEDSSLQDALQHTAQRWQKETGIPITMRTTGVSHPLPSAIEVTVLRAAQEALNNIRKHAQATDVRVTLSYMDDTIMLDVQDNGVGLAASQPSRFVGGFGLQAMRERVAQCGGIVMLESETDEGTTVTVSIPLIS